MLLPYGTDWFMEEFHKFEESTQAKNISASFQNLTIYIQNQTGLAKIDFAKTARLINGMEFSVRIKLLIQLNNS